MKMDAYGSFARIKQPGKIELSQAGNSVSEVGATDSIDGKTIEETGYFSKVGTKPSQSGAGESTNAEAASQDDASKSSKTQQSTSASTQSASTRSNAKSNSERVAADFSSRPTTKARGHSKKAASSQSSTQNSVKLGHSIGVKLISIISAIVVIALGGVTYVVSYFVSSDVRTSAEENNLAINSRTASDTESRITSAISSVALFLDLIDAAGDNETEIKSKENIFFNRNKSVVAVYLPESSQLFTSPSFFISRELEREEAENYFLQESDALETAKSGSIGISNASSFFNVPILSFFYPYMKGGKMMVAGVLYSADELSDSFSSGSVNQSFFVNNAGQVLVSSDTSLMMKASDMSQNPVVQKMMEGNQSNAQFTYRVENEVEEEYLDETQTIERITLLFKKLCKIIYGEKEGEFIGAYRKLSLGEGAVVTIVKTSIILEGVNATTRRNIYITIAILFFAVMIIYFFSKSMSTPLRQLTAIVNEINLGNFNTDLFAGLKTKRKDEIGVLAKSTKNEREILNTFTKLTNKGVTRAIIRKEIDFNPHLKDITIFFSDIRGFTAISDGFKNRFGEKSAGEIISFLNDYMSRMVSCITRTGGTVDKFEGDAIMAAWGVLRNDNLDFELLPERDPRRMALKREHDSHVKQDALSAITACIAMRYSLMLYNKEAEAFTKAHEGEPLAKYKPHIRIGSGLNSGRATVGFMGSFDKMEFTSIGDAVNFASRTEASNKPCGTDILITQDTYDILKVDFIRCEENGFEIKPENEKFELVVEQIPVDFEVKGKGKQHFFGVVNMPRFDIKAFFAHDKSFVFDKDCAKAVGPDGPKTLNEMRTLLGIPIPDFEKVNLDAEENKIQVAAP